MSMHISSVCVITNTARRGRQNFAQKFKMTKEQPPWDQWTNKNVPEKIKKSNTVVQGSSIGTREWKLNI